MASASTPAPGTKFGPCIDGCAHKDCACSRREAAALCVICKKPIGYERHWYNTSDGPGHATCVEDAATHA